MMSLMRTTLSIDDDLASAIERLQAGQNLTLRDAINLLLRAGLERVEKSPTSSPYKGPVFDCAVMPGIDLKQALQEAKHR